MNEKRRKCFTIKQTKTQIDADEYKQLVNYDSCCEYINIRCLNLKFMQIASNYKRINCEAQTLLDSTRENILIKMK